jgi:uncharacterized protein (DUF4415 family)
MKRKSKPRFTAEDIASVESPPLTEKQLAEFRPIREAAPEILALIRRFRGPQKRATKHLISLRLDPDVIEHFRARGKGWQARINATLRKAAGI